MSFIHERFLIEAVEQCHLYKIITLIESGHNIHIQSNLGRNLLIHLLKQPKSQDPVLKKKRLQMFQFLIKHGNLDIHLVDDYGKNIFNWATNLNCTEEALYLLRSYSGDIDILTRDQSGLCSLHYAIEHGNETLVRKMVKYFLKYHIRFDIKDNHNNTPEELARKLGYDVLADYLLETCRLTVFSSREIPFTQQRLLTNKTTATTNTKLSMTTSSSSMSDSSEFHNLIEARIQAARNLNDWKTVAALRSNNKKNPNEKKINQRRQFINKISLIYFVNILFTFRNASHSSQ
jgi:ankyrin repeat protein